MKKDTTKKIKTEWDLSSLYKNDKDPQIEKDVASIEAAYAAFEKKYKGKDFISTPKKLLVALEESEALEEKMASKDPWRYFALRSDLNSGDSVAGAAATRIEQRLSVASNKITFFTLEIAKIEKRKQKEFLEDASLAPFRYLLERIFNHAQYNLSEKEEQIIDLLSQTSYGMWVDGQQRVLAQQTVSFKKEEVPIAKAMSMLSDLPKAERKELGEKINAQLEKNSPFAEAEINAVYNFKKIMDEQRGYKKPYSATILGYENDEKTIEGLVALVTKYFTLSSRFYVLHGKLLGEKKGITYADRNVKIGSINKKFDFDSAVTIVKNAFSQVDPEYAGIVDSFLANGQIDVYPKKGKKGGAYCWGSGTLPTVVLLNHTDDVRSVETLAHEMGHAIHSEFSKKQPPRYRRYSTATAEVASTFFEQLVGDEIEKTLNDEEKIIMLHNKIMGDISTIFRQIACFNFELELHNEIRSKGELDRKGIATLLQKHMQQYLGKSVTVTEQDGYFFVGWSHIRRFFYVYSYAYGQLVSRALYENWKADHSYAAKIRQFLSAGRSMSPKDIFKSIGITTNEAFFEAGLKGIEADINKLEKLAKKYKKI